MSRDQQQCPERSRGDLRAERDFIYCPACSEFVSLRGSVHGEVGRRKYTCWMCEHRFPEPEPTDPEGGRAPGHSARAGTLPP